MRKRYTASAEKVLENAGKEAVSRGMSYVFIISTDQNKRCCG